mgnify:CR=1 FL=1
MSIKTDAVVIRDETTTGANTATRVGTNLVDIADDLVAKQAEIDLNSAKVGVTAQMVSDINTNNLKVGVTTEEANTIDSEPIGNESQVLQVVSISQANYDLITPVATTLYVING